MKNPTTMIIEWWPVDKPTDYARNARKITEKAVDKVAASLKEFGWKQVIVVDKEGVIVCGHVRRRAARKLGMTTVPVLVAADLTPGQIKAYRLMDNRSNDEVTFDLDLVGTELMDLKEIGVDLGLTGFDPREIEGMLRTCNPREDVVPEVPLLPVSRPGDMWLMGQHRILCGDSTAEADVWRVTKGQRAGLMNTDPPYGVAYANDQRPNPGVAKPRVAKPRVANDALQGDELKAMLTRVFLTAKGILSEDAAWYIWFANIVQHWVFAAAAAAQLKLHREIIWVKPVLLLGRGQYHWKHEPCFMGWVEGHQPPDYSPRNETTVWEVDGVKQAERKEFNHSTPKPVELFRRPILKHLKHNEICYEPFAGTGPQFIAAEMESRRCFGLEVEPAFVDVIVTRWQNLTGQQATLDGHGATFSHVREGRLLGAEDELNESILEAEALSK